MLLKFKMASYYSWNSSRSNSSSILSIAAGSNSDHFSVTESMASSSAWVFMCAIKAIGSMTVPQPFLGQITWLSVMIYFFVSVGSAFLIAWMKKSLRHMIWHFLSPSPALQTGDIIVATLVIGFSNYPLLFWSVDVRSRNVSLLENVNLTFELSVFPFIALSINGWP